MEQEADLSPGTLPRLRRRSREAEKVKNASVRRIVNAGVVKLQSLSYRTLVYYLVWIKHLAKTGNTCDS